MDDVAVAGGVSRGSIFNPFPFKKGLQENCSNIILSDIFDQKCKSWG